MPKVKMAIIGKKTHDVAYRSFLLSVAEGFEIDRFSADNLKRGGKEVVVALVEGDTEKIETFKEFVSNNFPENASVDDVVFSDYDGPVMGVESFYRYLTASQLSKIGTYGGQMLDKQDQSLGKMDQMLDKQDQSLGKMDQMLGKQDKMLGKQDKMLDKQTETVETIKVESQKTREELSSVIKDEGEKTRDTLTKHLGDDITELRQEIASIKATLSRVLEKVEA